eukprot:376530-Amorphochlora_amoeboformis.AAC.2
MEQYHNRLKLLDSSFALAIQLSITTPGASSRVKIFKLQESDSFMPYKSSASLSFQSIFRSSSSRGHDFLISVTQHGHIMFSKRPKIILEVAPENPSEPPANLGSLW